MNTTLECLPCIFRQTLDAVRRVSDDPALHARVVREVAGWIHTSDLSQSPPVMAQRLHRFLRAITGITDPYAQAKQRDNALALSLMADLRSRIAVASDPLLLALRLAIAGNLIDLGPKHDLTEEDIVHSIQQVEQESFIGDVERFRKEAAHARKILYLADNAGEIVLDRLLVEALGADRITVAVRGAPVINDATMDDAQTAGLPEIVRVISNGSDAPGTVLDECTPEFQELFAQADMVISKGQGNFETLSDTSREICFLFKVKCPVIASSVGLPLGTQALLWTKAGDDRKDKGEP
jgi:hypothetical protein